LVTPFAVDGSVDTGALSRIVEASYEGGMDFLCVLGPLSESEALSSDEKKLVRETVLEANAGRFPLLLGLDRGISAPKLSMMPVSAYEGFEAFLIAASDETGQSQDALFQYFCEAARFSPLPIVIDNLPAVRLLPETLLRLADECPKIIGVNCHTDDYETAGQLIDGRPEGFCVLSGADEMTCGLMMLGADGTLSAIANAMPETEWLLVHSFSPEGAAQAYRLMKPYVELLPKERESVGIKTLLHLMGNIENGFRAPLAPASENLIFEFRLLLK